MTKNRDRKHAIRALATEKNIPYQQAERLYNAQHAQRRADTQQDTPEQNADRAWPCAAGMCTRWRCGTSGTPPSAPTRSAATPTSGTAPWSPRRCCGATSGKPLTRVADLARDADNTEPDRLATATSNAAILYQEQAARVRFEHRIPTLHPGAQTVLLHLGTCQAFGRPWQLNPDGACGQCPAFFEGPTPASRDNAEKMRASGHEPTQVTGDDLMRHPPSTDDDWRG